ncbi:3-oxoacyl-[acyl-carrier protein] reductase [hydrothermal vent metagenome]|uniref:3-oxoacyl-[acyl-carrier protein] reductase n=1 Tax=hydrothermal vent metagenome TaxID=652676 RepID=A0A3B1BR68_9ZZZZ
MIDLTGKWALITGASGGIGKDLAWLFAKDGANLVLVARNASRLSEVKDEIEKKQGVNVITVVKDLTKLESADEIFSELEREKISVSALVNNAGVGVFGDFSESNPEGIDKLLLLNIFALTRMTKLFLEKFAEKGGAILNVASTAAFQPGPGMAVYYASKAYVVSFSEALAEELAGKGITVTCLCPGPTKTEFFDTVNMGKPFFLKVFGEMDSRRVALYGYNAIKNKKTLVVAGLFNRLTVFSVRFAPRKLIAKISSLLNRPSV